MESLLSLLRIHRDHEPTPDPSQEGNGQDAKKCPLLSWEGPGVRRFMESLRFCTCIGTMNHGIGAPAAGPARSLLHAAGSRRAGGRRSGSWEASFRFGACIGTMNPPLAPPRRGTDRTRTHACSPPGKGRGWVGSWRAACASHSSPNQAAKPHGIGKRTRDIQAAGMARREERPEGGRPFTINRSSVASRRASASGGNRELKPTVTSTAPLRDGKCVAECARLGRRNVRE